MAEYIFTYKCRFCGQILKDAQTGDKNLAWRCVFGAITDMPANEPQAPTMLSVHTCDDHIGVADFIGCKIEGDT